MGVCRWECEHPDWCYSDDALAKDARSGKSAKEFVRRMDQGEFDGGAHVDVRQLPYDELLLLGKLLLKREADKAAIPVSPSQAPR